jgi:hypothetical protein
MSVSRNIAISRLLARREAFIKAANNQWVTEWEIPPLKSPPPPPLKITTLNTPAPLPTDHGVLKPGKPKFGLKDINVSRKATLGAASAIATALMGYAGYQGYRSRDELNNLFTDAARVAGSGVGTFDKVVNKAGVAAQAGAQAAADAANSAATTIGGIIDASTNKTSQTEKLLNDGRVATAALARSRQELDEGKKPSTAGKDLPNYEHTIAGDLAYWAPVIGIPLLAYLLAEGIDTKKNEDDDDDTK